MKSIFTDIYQNNAWNGTESISGTGSTLEQTKHIIYGIQDIIEKYDIKSILDIPCGDFNWMRHVDFGDTSYIGADIVPDIISSNKEQHKDVTFAVLDISEDRLPDADLIITRDCLVHFSFADIIKTMKNLKGCSYQYILTTNFTHRALNTDIITGHWRTLNLKTYPFRLPDSLMDLSERCTENDGIYIDKCLSLWDKKSFEHCVKEL